MSCFVLMLPRPPVSTRTRPLFPYPALVRSAHLLCMPRLDSACLHNSPTVPCNALLVAARLAAARGDYAASIDLLERLETLGMEREVTRPSETAEAERVRVTARPKQHMRASINLAALVPTMVSKESSSSLTITSVKLTEHPTRRAL